MFIMFLHVFLIVFNRFRMIFMNFYINFDRKYIRKRSKRIKTIKTDQKIFKKIKITKSCDDVMEMGF